MHEYKLTQPIPGEVLKILNQHNIDCRVVEKERVKPGKGNLYIYQFRSMDGKELSFTDGMFAGITISSYKTDWGY